MHGSGSCCLGNYLFAEWSLIRLIAALEIHGCIFNNFVENIPITFDLTKKDVKVPLTKTNTRIVFIIKKKESFRQNVKTLND